MSKTKPKRESRATWFQRVRDWQQSGISKAAYCHHHQLNPGSFYHWCSQYRRDPSNKVDPNPSTPFIPVSIQAESPLGSKHPANNGIDPT